MGRRISDRGLQSGENGRRRIWFGQRIRPTQTRAYDGSTRSWVEPEAEGPIVFLHVPKTAGTSLANMIQKQFAPGQALRCDGVGAEARLAGPHLTAHRFVHGHLDWSALDALTPAPRVVTLLREPVARVWSLYAYWRSFSWRHAERTNDFGIHYAKSVGPEEFFFDAPAGIRANYENAVVRQLLGARLCAPHVGFTVSDEEAVQIAKRRIDAMTFCGLTEEFERSSQEISRRLGLGPMEPRRDNGLAGRRGAPDFDAMDLVPPPSGGVLARLRKLTRLDAVIYRYARQVFENRLGDADDIPEASDATIDELGSV